MTNNIYMADYWWLRTDSCLIVTDTDEIQLWDMISLCGYLLLYHGRILSNWIFLRYFTLFWDQPNLNWTPTNWTLHKTPTQWSIKTPHTEVVCGECLYCRIRDPPDILPGCVPEHLCKHHQFQYNQQHLSQSVTGKSKCFMYITRMIIR